MAGIYVHIPYCKVKCHYCDFHFSTDSSSSTQMIEALCAEIDQRASYLKQDKISTIYFGGGTPTVLEVASIQRIIEHISDNFEVIEDVEITIEANPDDLSIEKLKALQQTSINRLSIGIQSFDQEVLSAMNRAHSAQEALDCVVNAQEMGFTNISADLIYGVPNKDLAYWQRQLKKMTDLNIPHISAYCLTIEPKTVFGNKFKKGELQLPTDEETLLQFKTMKKVLLDEGYLHYEISNFAKEGGISKHNSSYWLGAPYLGIGPSAHSFDGERRGWNVSHNLQYIKKVQSGDHYHEIEWLTEKDKFNDYILTRLRTHWGINLSDCRAFDVNLLDFEKMLSHHLTLNNVIQINDVIRLSDHGKFIADKIASDLFV